MSSEHLIKFLQAGHTFSLEGDDFNVEVCFINSNPTEKDEIRIYRDAGMDDIERVCAELMSHPVWQEADKPEPQEAAIAAIPNMLKFIKALYDGCDVYCSDCGLMYESSPGESCACGDGLPTPIQYKAKDFKHLWEDET